LGSPITGESSGVTGGRWKVKFSDAMVAERVQLFWAAIARGEFITDAAAQAGTHRKKSRKSLAAAGGVRPRRGRDLKRRCLTFAEREEIAVGRAGRESIRAIAARLRRRPSTVSRELARNVTGESTSSGEPYAASYRARTAHAMASERAGAPNRRSSPPTRRCATSFRKISKTYSPEQISGRLRVRFPDTPEMWVSTETIYQSIYVQSRGALRRDLARCLRTGRAAAAPVSSAWAAQEHDPRHDQHQRAARCGRDRAVPGHWEGDLIIGKRNLTAIGTLVERTSGYTMLLHLPDGYKPEQVRDALAEKDQDTPRRPAQLADVGPRTRDTRLETGQRPRRDRDLLLRSTRPVAARHQREHKRPAAPVLPERHRPVSSLGR
jgi:IS30 family transposase